MAGRGSRDPVGGQRVGLQRGVVTAGALAALIGADQVVIPGALGANLDGMDPALLRGWARFRQRGTPRGDVAAMPSGNVGQPDEGNGDGDDCPVVGGYDGAESDGRGNQKGIVAVVLLGIPSPGHKTSITCRGRFRKPFCEEM